LRGRRCPRTGPEIAVIFSLSIARSKSDTVSPGEIQPRSIAPHPPFLWHLNLIFAMTPYLSPPRLTFCLDVFAESAEVLI
jgi:hypothetical protein